jgi:hypothetical protein
MAIHVRSSVEHVGMKSPRTESKELDWGAMLYEIPQDLVRYLLVACLVSRYIISVKHGVAVIVYELEERVDEAEIAKLRESCERALSCY